MERLLRPQRRFSSAPCPGPTLVQWPQHLTQRYMLPKNATSSALAYRVALALSDGPREHRQMQAVMDQQRFWPAGNVLLAGVAPIRPNCCIFPPFKDDAIDDVIARAYPLWAARIGIGFDLGQCENPVRALLALSDANRLVPLGHRPQRGNMAVIPLSHERAREWAQCKTDRGPAHHCYNFNLSLTVDDSDAWRRASETGLLWALAVSAHASGDPGLVFLDRIRAGTPYAYARVAAELGPITTVVPCGEQGMHPNESCTLGAVNLAAPAHWHRTGGGVLNEDELRHTIRVGFRILDAAHQKQDYAGDERLRQTAQRTRRIGLGLMGWADVVARQSSGTYGDCSNPLIRRIGSVVQDEARRVHPRHLTATCVQPTGGINLLTGNAGFAVEPAMEEAHRYTPLEHLGVLDAWQPYIDNCIAKTINLDRRSTVFDVLDTFVHARAMPHCKAVTVYRDQSRGAQPMTCRSNRTSKGRYDCD